MEKAKERGKLLASHNFLLEDTYSPVNGPTASS